MKRRWRVVLIILLVLTGALAVLIGSVLWYLQTDSFQEVARAEIISRVRSATGMDVALAEVRLDLLQRKFAIRQFELKPRPGAAGAFRLGMDEARGSFRVGRLLHPRFRISDLVLVRPRIALLTGSGGGWRPEGFLKVFRKSLEFAAARVEVRDGWLEVDNRRVPFSVALDDLVCDIRFREAPERYDVGLAYRNSHFRWAGRDIVYDLESRMAVSLDGIQFTSLGIRHRESVLAGGGLLADWHAPRLKLHLGGPVEASDMVLFHSALAQARGKVDAAVDVDWDAGGFRASGTFAATLGDYGEVRFSDLRGGFSYARDVLDLRDVTAGIGTGSVRADGAFQLGSRPLPHRFRVEARNVPLESAALLLKIPEISFENSVDSSAVVAWRRGTSDLAFEGTITLHGLPVLRSYDEKRIPLEGSADVRYQSGIWHISRAEFQSPLTRVEAYGSGDASFRVSMATTRVAEPIAVLRVFSDDVRSLVRAQPGIMEATGRLELDGEVRFAQPGTASYAGRIGVERGRWNSFSVDHLDAHASWDGVELNLTSLRARLGDQSVDGGLRLQVPSAGSDGPQLQFTGKLRDFSLSSLTEYGLDVGPDVTGVLNGEGSVAYAEELWTGQGVLEVGDLGVAGQRFDGLSARVELGQHVLTVRAGELRRGSGTIRFNGTAQRPELEMKLSVSLEDLPLTDLQGLGKTALPLDGSFSASGLLSGVPDNPAFSGRFELKSLRYSSYELGEGTGTVKLENKTLELQGGVRSDLGALEGRALISTGTGFPGQASFDFRDWNLQRLAPAETPRLLSDLSTALQGRLEVDGKFAEPSSLRLRAELDGAHLKIRGYEFRNSGRIRFTISNHRLRIDEAKITGEGSDLVLGGEFPVGGESVMNLRLAGDLNLKVLDGLLEKLRVSGSARLDVRASGSTRDPEVIGQAILNGAHLDYAELPFNLRSVQGRLVFSRNIVRLESVRGNIATGSFEVAGAAEHRSGQIQSTNLQITVQRARIPFPKDFRTTFDAQLSLTGSLKSQVLSGQVSVIRAEYLRPLSVFEQLAAGSGARKPQLRNPYLEGLRLNIELQSNRGLTIGDEMVKLTAGFRLRLQGTPEYPSLVGRIEADEGSVLFRGNRFDFVYARADFFDRNRINPVLDARAEVDLKSYRLILDVKGPLDKLAVNLSSDPPLSTVDAVSLLTTGPTGASGNGAPRREAEVAGISAAGILSEGLTGGLTKEVERVFGFQSFRVDPFLAGADKDPTARVTITQRLSKDLRVTYSRNLSKSEEQIVILEYDLTKNISIVGIQDEKGGFGLDFRIRRRFR